MEFQITERKETVSFSSETEGFKYSGTSEVTDGEARNINVSIFTKSGEHVGSIGDSLTGYISLNISTQCDLQAITAEYGSIKTELLASI